MCIELGLLFLSVAGGVIELLAREPSGHDGHTLTAAHVIGQRGSFMAPFKPGLCLPGRRGLDTAFPSLIPNAKRTPP